MTKRRLGRTELLIEPLVFGCNVLGWTLEESAAYGVLDALLDGGFAAVDTADSYGKGKSESAPIASATSVEQLGSLMKSARLTLSAEDIKELSDAGK